MTDAFRVTTDCPDCGGPITWRRAVRHDGEPVLAILDWPCRCPLTAQVWGDVVATAAMVAEVTSPAGCRGELVELAR